MWVLQQYYVGADVEQVAIFQGVRGEVLGLPLHRVEERTDIALDDLPETERSSVRDGIITSEGLDGARGLVARLRDRMLAPCPVVMPESSVAAPGVDPALPPAGHHPAADAGAPARNDLPVGELMADTDRRSAPASPPPAALPTGRGIELILLAFAAVLVTGALVLVEANQEQELTRSLLFVGLAYLGLFTIAHLAVRRFAPYADPLILPCVALLNGLGLVMIHRLDLAEADQAAALGREAPTELIGRQVAWTAIGLALFVAVLWIVRDHRTVARYSYTAGFAGIVLLALPGLLPSSISEVNGAKLWIRIGPVGIQPGRVRQDPADRVLRRVPRAEARAVHHRGPPLPRHGAAARPRPRAAARGVGALGRRAGRRARPRYLAAVLRDRAGAALRRHRAGVLADHRADVLRGRRLIAYQLFGHVRVRVQIWLDPFADFDGNGYQIGQALFGLGTGGVGGTGLGAGRPDLVPFAYSDFMLSSLGEELGLIGLAAILVVYLVLITRGLRSALAVRDSFGKLLATGLAFTLALQVFIVIGGASKLIPLTGLTLPFLSYGGSSLVANYALVALLLRVSNAARSPLTRRPATAPPPIAEAGTELVERPR